MFNPPIGDSIFDTAQYPFEGAVEVKQLGQGTYSRVIQSQLTTGVMVAIKLVDPAEEYVEGLNAYTLRELSCLQVLRGCPGIIQLLNVETQLDTPQRHTNVQMMFAVHTSDLKAMIRVTSVQSRLRYFNDVTQQLLEGLAQMYHHGILHRDIKPNNILVDYQLDQLEMNQGTGRLVGMPRCFYADFGLAVQLSCNWSDYEQLTSSAYTASYRPPEIMVERAELANYTEKADIWAIGVTMVEYLTGQQLFSFEGNTNSQSQLSDASDTGDTGSGSLSGRWPMVYTVFQRLMDPPKLDQYSTYAKMIHAGTARGHVNVDQFLRQHLSQFHYQQLVLGSINRLTHMLAIDPHLRPSITELVQGLTLKCVPSQWVSCLGAQLPYH